ncbi:RTA-like protein [Lasiodiplodia theobromae]|nr:RTA-like protein [Lasiodiplodia theobromae]
MYPILGHIIHETGGERLALVRASWRTKILLLGDILSGATQAIGGVMISRANGSKAAMERGEQITAIGLIIQLGFLCLFLVLAIHYNFRIKNNLTDASWYVDWRTYLGILYFAGGLIVIRTAFRLIEYVQGDEGELRSSEVYLYLFDAALILPAMAIFNFKHPSFLVVKGDRLRPDNEDAMESNTYLLPERGTK